MRKKSEYWRVSVRARCQVCNAAFDGVGEGFTNPGMECEYGDWDKPDIEAIGKALEHSVNHHHRMFIQGTIIPYTEAEWLSERKNSVQPA